MTSYGLNQKLCDKILRIELLRANCTPGENLDSVPSGNHLTGVRGSMRILTYGCMVASFLCALFIPSSHFQYYKFFEKCLRMVSGIRHKHSIQVYPSTSQKKDKIVNAIQNQVKSGEIKVAVLFVC